VGVGRRASAGAVGLALLALVAACGDGGKGSASSAGPTLAAAEPTFPLPSLPASVPAGAAVFAIGDQQIELTVTSCSLSPEAAVGSVLDVQLAVNASGPDGSTLTVTSVRASDAAGGAGSSLTQSVTFRRGDEIDTAQRFAVDGHFRDPTDSRAAGALLQVDGATVSGGGLFATEGTASGTPSSRPGALRLTCR
jgi:hypothetical protein